MVIFIHLEKKHIEVLVLVGWLGFFFLLFISQFWWKDTACNKLDEFFNLFLIRLASGAKCERAVSGSVN